LLPPGQGNIKCIVARRLRGPQLLDIWLGLAVDDGERLRSQLQQGLSVLSDGSIDAYFQFPESTSMKLLQNQYLLNRLPNARSRPAAV
jgi:hypothetical protein